MIKQLNETVLFVMKKIENSGFSSYIAGGTVRELLMNETPASYILITTAKKTDIRMLFKKTTEQSNTKNLISVIENKIAFDIYCKSEGNSDNEKHIKDILKSFDFTMNSLCFNEKSGIIDYFGGLKDIEERIIKLVDLSQLALAKKPERMLRAVRYSAQLGFEIDETTAIEIKKCAILIKRAQGNKLREEIEKILMSNNPDYIKKASDLGLLKYILPEVDVCFGVEQRNKYHIYNVGEHIVHAVKNTPNDISIRWAALLHDIGKPLCKSVDQNGIIHFYGHHRESVRLATDILRRFKIDASITKEILTLVECHDIRIDATPQSVKKMMMRTSAEVFPKLLLLQEADNKAKNMKFFADKLNKLNDVRKIYQKVIAERHPYRVCDLAINGRDLNKLGFRPGHEIGDALQSLLEEVLIDPGLNTREYLFARAKQIKKRK